MIVKYVARNIKDLIETNVSVHDVQHIEEFEDEFRLTNNTVRMHICSGSVILGETYIMSIRKCDYNSLTIEG